MLRSARRGLGLVGIGLGTVVFGTATAHAAEVHTVGDTTTADFATISDAITAASAGDFIVVVDQGTYAECLEIDKDLTLVGSRAEDSSSSTGLGSVTVECSGSDPALSIDAATATLVGIDLTHRGGQGARIVSADATLVDVTITGTSTSGDGGGIYVEASDLALHRVMVDGASSGRNGGGLFATDSDVVIRDSTFKNNEAVGGAGLYVVDSTLDAQRLTSSDNAASGNGGGLHYGGSVGTLNLRDSTLGQNAAASGGGLYLGASNTVRELARLTVDGNEATTDAGGLFVTHPVILVDSTVSNNTAGSTAGGAAFTASVTVRKTTFDSNEATGNCGGMYTNAGATLQGTTFSSNSTGISGGGLCIFGGAVTDNDSFYEANTAVTSGGGVYAGSAEYTNRGGVFDGNSVSDGDGGGLWINANNSSIRNYLYGTTFENNTALSGSGGGLAIATNAYLLAYGIEVSANEADIGGGLHFADLPRRLQIFESRIHGNDARLGGGVASVDSALDTSSGTFSAEIGRTRIYDNAATEHGGGVYVQYTGVRLYDSWLYENTAKLDGGGMYTDGHLYVLARGGLICGNEAGRRGGGVAWIDAWGTRQLYSMALVGNQSVSDGGALYMTGMTTTSGYRSVADLYYLSVLGNDSSGTVFDGIHHNNTGSTVGFQSAYYIHYGFQPYSSNSQSSSSRLSSTVRSSTYASGSVPILNNPTYRVGDSYGNVSADPGWTRYTSSDCFDDVLTTRSFGSYGANATTGAYGRRNYDDSDRDGLSIAAGDCNDGDSRREPGNTEIIGNGIDEDCVGWDDRDGDDDGYAPVSLGGMDCDDTDAAINPDATETWYDGTDSDCDGLSDDDQDGDGFDDGVDCNDTDASIHPDAIESAFDGVDQDCDGIDLDLDGDGYMGVYTTGDGSTQLTEPDEGEADCAVADPAISPAAEEIWYDGIDQDCDAADDYDQDMDGDRSAEFDPDELGGDCDDTDPEISSLAEETWYDGIDQNCDGLSDFDQDLDGDDARAYGGGDCDDENDQIYTGAPDILDFDDAGRPIDNDCDFKANPDDDGDGVLNWYEEQQGTNPGQIDSDGDRIPDGVEWGDIETHEQLLTPFNSDEPDGDDIIDALDSDSDDDGLSDADEAGVTPRNPRDTDGDGLPDYRDADDDDDGLDTSEEIAEGIRDSDGDGLDNHLDPDSDNDGVSDGAERPGDSDGDGVPDYLDAGSDYGQETEPAPPDSTGFGLGCSTTGSSAPLGLPLLLLPGLLVLRRRRRD